MKDIEIKITKSTRYVDIPKEVEKAGNEGENLQTNLVFSFTDNFIDGQGRLEYTIDGESRYVFLTKVGETYQTPIKSEMTKYGAVDMQLVITEGTDENEIPKFKSNVFYLPFGKSINAEVEQPEEYEEWIDVANTKLNEIDEALVESETQSAYAKEQGDYASEQGQFAQEQAENVQSDILNIRNIADEANDKSDTAISVSKGANQSISYLNYQNMITNFNAFEKEKFITGQQVMIKTLNVPDMWIYQLTDEYQYYTYTTDEEVINLLLSDNGFHVGYYVLSALETQKVNLIEYVKFNDVASYNKSGVVKVHYGTFGLTVSEGYIVTELATNGEIDAKKNKYKPIVPYNLEYAVKSVVGGHVTLTQSEYDALETKDENTYYYIEEE